MRSFSVRAAFLLPTAIAAVGAAHRDGGLTPACPSGTMKMAVLTYSPFQIEEGGAGGDAATASPPPPPEVPLVVCEDLTSANGTILFIGDAPPFPITLNKSVYANTVHNDDAYLGDFTKGRARTDAEPLLQSLQRTTYDNNFRPTPRSHWLCTI